MKTIHKIKIDLLTPGLHPRVYAVQDDICTREVQISLYSGSVSWTPTSGAGVAVGYRKSDGTVGIYDTLPDGSSAVSISGNVVTVILAAQMLTCAGTVEAAVTLADANGNQISTFAFDVIVSANPGSGAIKSEDYFNYVNPKIQAVIEQAAAATTAANTAASRANASAELAEDAYDLADTANQKVNTLREVVSKLHSNIVETARGEVIQLSDASDMGLAGLRIFGKTTQNGIPTPEAPVPLANVGESGSVTVKVIGKNLLNQHSSNWQSEETTNNITYTYVRDSDGNLLYINAKGTNTTASNAHAKKAFTTLPAGTYTVTGCPSGYGGDISLRVGKGDSGTYLDVDQGSGCTFTLTEETIISINPMVGAGKTVSNVKFYPMIRLASETDATYEPYISTEVTVNADNGLPGIPVTSGGNYTDSNGKQWICDEVDFENGVYVQRVRKVLVTQITSTSNSIMILSDTAGAKKPLTIISNYTDGAKFGLTDSGENIFIRGSANASANKVNLTYTELNALLAETPMVLVYALAEEKHIPLSEIDPDALAQYATLHTNYPNTTISNDAGAGMEVKYVADTQKYVDKKFEALEAAIANLI